MGKEVISTFNRFGQPVDGHFVIASAEVWKKLKTWQKIAVIRRVAETYYTANNSAGFRLDTN